MNIPEILSNFKIYQEGEAKLIGVANIKLPKLNFKSEVIKGVGIPGEYERIIFNFLSPMEFSINFRLPSQKVLELLSLNKVKYECEGYIQEASSSTYGVENSKIKINLHGENKNIDLGTLKIGKIADTEVDYTCLFLKIEIGGKNIILIDVQNGLIVINKSLTIAGVRALANTFLENEI